LCSARSAAGARAPDFLSEWAIMDLSLRTRLGLLLGASALAAACALAWLAPAPPREVPPAPAVSAEVPAPKPVSPRPEKKPLRRGRRAPRRAASRSR
jgi:hypothetical protein